MDIFLTVVLFSCVEFLSPPGKIHLMSISRAFSDVVILCFQLLVEFIMVAFSSVCFFYYDTTYIAASNLFGSIYSHVAKYLKIFFFHILLFSCVLAPPLGELTGVELTEHTTRYSRTISSETGGIATLAHAGDYNCQVL